MADFSEGSTGCGAIKQPNMRTCNLARFWGLMCDSPAFGCDPSFQGEKARKRRPRRLWSKFSSLIYPGAQIATKLWAIAS